MKKTKILFYFLFIFLFSAILVIPSLAVEQTEISIDNPTLSIAQYSTSGAVVYKNFGAESSYYTDFGSAYGLGKIYQFNNVFNWSAGVYTYYGDDIFTVDLTPKKDILSSDKVTYIVIRYCVNLQKYSSGGYYNYGLDTSSAKLLINGIPYKSTLAEAFSNSGPYIFENVISNPNGIKLNTVKFQIRHYGKPNQSDNYFFQFGLMQNSLMEFQKGSDSAVSAFDNAGNQLDVIGHEIESPVSRPELPDVEMPPFSLQFLYSRGDFMPFLVTLAVLSASVALVGYVIYGKRG